MNNTAPLISIITATYNCVDTIESTIKSVLAQSYPNVEYIIIDGQSTDGTIDIIKRYEDSLTIFVSEPDRGIYDAMNKGIRASKGIWLNFMNSGDLFHSEDSILNSLNNLDDKVGFIYSDFFVYKKQRLKLIHASYDRGIVLHQSVIYKRELHSKYGEYIVSQKYIISDYLFFQLIPSALIKKSLFPISINSAPGVSAGNWTWYQKICFDYIFRKISVLELLRNLVIRVIKNCIISCLKLVK
ncbi:glycosyltransferase [Pedobacter sp. MR2016-19]|uniref:glycosyltransferase family 2 protein n=1 Tax=Pedobacter sp. MR2016-19 TaxID=2780089 RepID=UPI00187673B8|nr:glycosyltransferase family 2 protein [Pedobacter sp. MR2016-19]MBE5321997.1 glycosyltransferase [Pedobacter sp. MR2016-19]